MAKHRFYLPPGHWGTGVLVLDEEESHHCLEVMRCREGEAVRVFDGEGREAEAVITRARRRAVELEVGREERSPRPAVTLTLAQAIPKGKNMDLVVQKATELGVGRIVPLFSERTVVQFAGEDGEKKRSKWERVAIEACKQCGQNWLPRVCAPQDYRHFLDLDEDDLRLVAAIGGEARSLKAILAGREGKSPPRGASVIIGPEGDFTTEELALARDRGVDFLSLGPLVLRSETAALHALGLLAYEFA